MDVVITHHVINTCELSITIVVKCTGRAKKVTALENFISLKL